MPTVHMRPVHGRVLRGVSLALVLTLLSACAGATSGTAPSPVAPSAVAQAPATSVAVPSAQATRGPAGTAAVTATPAAVTAAPVAVTAAPAQAADETLRAAGFGLLLPPGFSAELYASGLHKPTALAFGPDTRLYITQLRGEEGDSAGQVLAVDGPGATPVVLLEQLFKPTGLVWRGNDLFVVAGRDLLQSGVAQGGGLRQPTAVLRDLPFNTRSEGQIDLLPDGRLLFEASGLVQDDQGGRLFTLVPGEQPQLLATGLKNAYGHALDPASGALYTTDVGDDPVDGQPPPEEINALVAGGDYGWPLCYAGRIPARDRGATAERCAATQPAIVTFPPHTTPTGLVFYASADFPAAYRNALYVALWNGIPPQVLRVTLQRDGAGVVGTATPFIAGIKRPIDLLADPSGGLLVLDYEAGSVYRVRAEAH